MIAPAGDRRRSAEWQRLLNVLTVAKALDGARDRVVYYGLVPAGDGARMKSDTERAPASFETETVRRRKAALGPQFEVLRLFGRGGVAFVGDVVGAAREGVDGLDRGHQAARQQEGGNREILVMLNGHS